MVAACSLVRFIEGIVPPEEPLRLLTECVGYWVDPNAIYRRIDCIAVVPAQVTGFSDEAHAMALGAYLERVVSEHALESTPRVFGPRERDRIAREHYLRVDDPDLLLRRLN